jgi:phosphoketolase
MTDVLSTKERMPMDACWRTANYLAVRQIYLLYNQLLREPRRADHIKAHLLGIASTPADAEDAFRFRTPFFSGRRTGLQFPAGRWTS